MEFFVPFSRKKYFLRNRLKTKIKILTKKTREIKFLNFFSGSLFSSSFVIFFLRLTMPVLLQNLLQSMIQIGVIFYKESGWLNCKFLFLYLFRNHFGWYVFVLLKQENAHFFTVMPLGVQLVKVSNQVGTNLLVGQKI